jgi:hypothetical protein
MRCHGTNSRYAYRCRRQTKPGEVVCGLHRDQEQFVREVLIPLREGES